MTACSRADTLLGVCSDSHGRRTSSNDLPRVKAGHFFVSQIIGRSTASTPDADAGTRGPRNTCIRPVGWPVGRMIGLGPEARSVERRPVTRSPGPMTRPPGAVSWDTWIDRPDGTTTGSRRLCRLLLRLQLTPAQIVFPLAPGPFAPLAFDLLPVLLQAPELIHDRIGVLVGRLHRWCEGGHAQFFQILEIGRGRTVTKVHPALTVGPAIQGLGRHRRSEADKQQNQSARHKAAEPVTICCGIWPGHTGNSSCEFLRRCSHLSGWRIPFSSRYYLCQDSQIFRQFDLFFSPVNRQESDP